MNIKKLEQQSFFAFVTALLLSVSMQGNPLGYFLFGFASFAAAGIIIYRRIKVGREGGDYFLLSVQCFLGVCAFIRPFI